VTHIFVVAIVGSSRHCPLYICNLLLPYHTGRRVNA